MPTFDQIDTDVVGAYNRTWEVLLSKYNTAGSWATWAQSVLENSISDIEELVGNEEVTNKINTLVSLLDSLGSFTPGSLTYTDAGFTDSVLDDLKAAVTAALGTSSTGLGDAEAALFGKHTARIAAERAAAYNEITLQFSSRGFDLPPGALLAKQTEMNNTASIRLADASADIMAESARLAVDYNKSVLSAATGLVDVMGRLYDSRVMRDFEAAKTEVLLGVDGYKASLAAIEVKAGLASKGADLAINGLIKQMEVRVSALQGLAQNASQMIASALASVSASTSFGYSASAGSSTDNGLSAKIASNERIAAISKSGPAY